MRNLSQADAALASAIDRLTRLRLGTTAEINAVQLLKAELNSARAALDETRSRITALEEENRSLRNSPEAAARAMLSRFGAMFEHALDAILIADDDGRYIAANPAACSLLGYSREELLQCTVADVTPESHRHLVPQAWREFIASGTMNGEYLVQRRSGETIAVEFRAVANVLPGEYLSILRDVSRLRHAQQNLHARQQEQRVQALNALYAVLDTLLAARLDAQADRGWRATFMAPRTEIIGAEIERAMGNVRAAIDSLEEPDPGALG